MEEVSVTMPKDLIEEIESQLDYGDSRSGWIRDACQEKLDREAGGQGNGNPATA